MFSLPAFLKSPLNLHFFFGSPRWVKAPHFWAGGCFLARGCDPGTKEFPRGTAVLARPPRHVAALARQKPNFPPLSRPSFRLCPSMELFGLAPCFSFSPDPVGRVEPGGSEAHAGLYLAVRLSFAEGSGGFIKLHIPESQDGMRFLGFVSQRETSTGKTLARADGWGVKAKNKRLK